MSLDQKTFQLLEESQHTVGCLVFYTWEWKYTCRHSIIRTLYVTYNRNLLQIFIYWMISLKHQTQLKRLRIFPVGIRQIILVIEHLKSETAILLSPYFHECIIHSLQKLLQTMLLWAQIFINKILAQYLCTPAFRTCVSLVFGATAIV